MEALNTWAGQTNPGIAGNTQWCLHDPFTVGSNGKNIAGRILLQVTVSSSVSPCLTPLWCYFVFCLMLGY